MLNSLILTNYTGDPWLLLAELFINLPQIDPESFKFGKKRFFRFIDIYCDRNAVIMSKGHFKITIVFFTIIDTKIPCLKVVI